MRSLAKNNHYGQTQLIISRALRILQFFSMEISDDVSGRALLDSEKSGWKIAE
jgi:hypothetical protein